MSHVKVSRLGAAATLAVSLLAGGIAWSVGDADKPASPADKCDAQCPVAAKVSTVLASWKAAAAAAKDTPEAEKTKLGAQVAALAGQCPVGSRMGETLGFVKAVLSSAIELEKSCAKECPIAGSGDKAAIELKAARARLVAGLDELAGHATCAGSCPVAAAAAADTSGLPERALVLLASWDKVPAELARVPAEKAKQLAAEAGALAQRSPSLALLPATVDALRAGLGALDAMNGQLCDWVKAHQDLFKEVPEAAKKGLATQLALQHAAAQILERTQAALQGCGAGKGASGAETAAVK